MPRAPKPVLAPLADSSGPLGGPLLDPAMTTIFSGNAHPSLTKDIAYHLQLPVGRISVGRFSDGDTILADAGLGGELTFETVQGVAVEDDASAPAAPGAASGAWVSPACDDRIGACDGQQRSR